MIRYDLKCAQGHGFEAWFRDAAAFEVEQAEGRLQCPACGSVEVRKALMAPSVRPARAKRAKPPEAAPETAPEPPPPKAPAPSPPINPTGAPPSNPAEGGEMLAAARAERAALKTAMRKFRAFVEQHTRDVGRGFADEARKMHFGETEPDAIRGQATKEEAEALRKDGVPFGVAPDFEDDQTN